MKHLGCSTFMNAVTPDDPFYDRGKHISAILFLNPFRTAVPFWGQITSKLSELSPKRDCGSKGVRDGVPRPQIVGMSTLISKKTFRRLGPWDYSPRVISIFADVSFRVRYGAP